MLEIFGIASKFLSEKVWYVLIAILLIASIWWNYSSMTSEIEETKKSLSAEKTKNALVVKDLSRAEKINRENKETLEQIKEDYKKTLDLLHKKSVEDKARTIEITKLKQRILNVKKEDDAPVAAVLYYTLERLRTLQSRATTADSNRTY